MCSFWFLCVAIILSIEAKNAAKLHSVTNLSKVFAGGQSKHKEDDNPLFSRNNIRLYRKLKYCIGEGFSKAVRNLFLFNKNRSITINQNNEIKHENSQKLHRRLKRSPHVRVKALERNNFGIFKPNIGNGLEGRVIIPNEEETFKGMRHQSNLRGESLNARSTHTKGKSRRGWFIIKKKQNNKMALSAQDSK